MTDLIRLAAKAAGPRVRMTDYSDRTSDHWVIRHADGVWRRWDPENDDGDSQKLAVYLRLNVIQQTSTSTGKAVAAASGWSPEDYRLTSTDYNGDPAAATRAAVLKASALVGENWDKLRGKMP